MSEKRDGKKIYKSNKKANGTKKKQKTIELNDGTIIKASCVYKKKQHKNG